MHTGVASVHVRGKVGALRERWRVGRLEALDDARRQERTRARWGFFLFFITLGLDLSDTKVYEL